MESGEVNRGGRIFLRIAYDGSRYCGWQIQPDGSSVQEEIQTALSLLLRKPISITGAGRTDAGVNAYAMIAHADLPLNHPPLDKIRNGLNGILQHKGISIHSIIPVHPDAHARFDALSRRYLYYIGTEHSPFGGDFCWVRRSLPDMRLMNEACQYLLGEHDFTSFCKLHSDTKHNRCTVTLARWQEVHCPDVHSMMSFEVEANRFLHGMVRTIVGTMLDIGYGKRAPESISTLIASEDRTLAGISVPARGLFFAEATYPEWIYNTK